MIVQSQVKASLTIYDAWLDLQNGFAHSGKGDGKPISAFFPLTISSKSTAAILFSICLENTWAKGVILLLFLFHALNCSLYINILINTDLIITDKAEASSADSIVNLKYGISGSRSLGAHAPVINESMELDGAAKHLVFQSALVLQRPALDPFLAVGFLPLPSSGLQVGQLVTMKWRVERLKDLRKNAASDTNVSPEMF